MDEAMEDFIEGFSEPSDIDSDYEFDADRFYDFSRTETNSQTEEAERWFEIAESYPPSPLIVKLNLGKGIYSSSDNCKNVKSAGNNGGFADGCEVSQSTESCKGAEDNRKAKTKSVPKPSKQRTSTLMKPTASHLAKLNKAIDGHGSYARSRTPSTHMDKRSLQNVPGFDNLATKRQKLEIGYLRKVAHLKHQNILLHKISKKVTIPKEPELETLQRAQNRRSRNNSEPGEHAESRTSIFKARPLNKKILQAPSLLPPKKSRPQLPEFQVFHLKTMQRAMQHSSANELNKVDSKLASQNVAANLRTNSHDALKEKYERLLKIKTRSLNNKIFPAKEDNGCTQIIREEATVSMQESKLLKNGKILENPPTELFNKLSLRSELESDTVSQQNVHLHRKGSKENTPDFFQPEFWKCVRKPNQCGNGSGMAGIANQPNMNRSLGIR